MTMTMEPAIRRQKLTNVNQMRLGQWLLNNATILPTMPLEEITGALNGQTGIDQPVAPKQVKLMLARLDLNCKPQDPAADRLTRAALKQNILELQGRVERLEEALLSLQKSVSILQATQ